MTVCYLLLNTNSKLEHSVYNKIQNMENIESIDPLFSEWKFIIKIKAKTFEIIEDKIVNEIKKIDGIIDTKLLTGMN